MVLSPLFHIVILSSSRLALFSSLVSFKNLMKAVAYRQKTDANIRGQICTLTQNVLILPVRTDSCSLSTASWGAMTLLNIVSSYTSHLFTPPHIHHKKVFWSTVKGSTKLTSRTWFSLSFCSACRSADRELLSFGTTCSLQTHIGSVLLSWKVLNAQKQLLWLFFLVSF